MSGASLAKSRVIFVRHGQTDFNIGGRVQGVIDIELNEAGRAQAASMGPLVAALQPDVIVSSDLSRAMDTALEISIHVGLEVVADPRIRERNFGAFEGMTRDEMLAQHPKWYRDWRSSGDCAQAQVESREDVGERFAEAAKEVVSTGPGTYVFVSHGSAITQGITHMLGIAPGSWSGLRGLDNCHWSILEQADRSPYWRLVGHNIGA